MEDAMQLDLVDYITDNIGDDDMQSCVSPLSSAGGVHYEHRPISSGEAVCVHIEHTQASPPVMSAHRLLLCLIVLGWSERELARRLRRHQTTIRRWTDGSGIVDRTVAEWLEALVGFHTAHPAPRAVDGIGLPSGSPIPTLLRGPGPRAVTT